MDDRAKVPMLTGEQQRVVQKTEEFVRARLGGEGSGHDWWHVHRVHQNAQMLARTESVDLFIVQLGALLHDIADWKFHGGDHEAGCRIAEEWLTGLGLSDPQIQHISSIIADISFRGAGEVSPMKTLEGMVVQDADRLDALGAIGIARTFTYGGYKGRPMYDPEIKPQRHETFEQYKNSEGTSINHFYEKLLLLKDLMNTETARRIAGQRHAFIEQYLAQFLSEWGGDFSGDKAFGVQNSRQ